MNAASYLAAESFGDQWHACIALLDRMGAHVGAAGDRLHPLGTDTLSGVLLAQMLHTAESAGGDLPGIAEIVNAGYAGEVAALLYFGAVSGYAIRMADETAAADAELAAFAAFWDGVNDAGV